MSLTFIDSRLFDDPVSLQHTNLAPSDSSVNFPLEPSVYKVFLKLAPYSFSLFITQRSKTFNQLFGLGTSILLLPTVTMADQILLVTLSF